MLYLRSGCIKTTTNVFNLLMHSARPNDDQKIENVCRRFFSTKFFIKFTWRDDTQ